MKLSFSNGNDENVVRNFLLKKKYSDFKSHQDQRTKKKYNKL